MRLVHLADLHLGFRQFTATTAAGVNVRETDVARAFVDVMTQTIALAPDLVLVAGDVFHSSRPPNAAIVLAHREFVRLRTALPNAVIVMVTGDHDLPRSADMGNIMALFESIGAHVANRSALRIAVPALDLSILAVPKVPGVRPMIAPDPSAKYNVVVLHGEVGHAEADDVHPWDYVALGHYHVHRVVAPRTCYAGAIDYTSTNPWGELAEQTAQNVPGKGFVVYGLDDDDPQFVPITPSRVFVDLPTIEAAGKTAAEVDALIAAAVVRAGGLTGKVARLRVENISRDVSSALDRGALRRYRLAALHFQLVYEKPAAAITVGMSPAPRTKSLDAMLDAAIDTRELGAELDRAELKRLAHSYLEQAAAREQDASAASESAVA